jgi:hypothetical protein
MKIQDLPGWCPPAKEKFLTDWVREHKPKVIVEIGVYGGRSLLPMALIGKEYGAKVVGIDCWDPTPCLEGMVEPHNKDWWKNHSHLGPVHKACKDAIAALGLTNVELWQGTSDQYSKSFQDKEIGLLSVDGNHGPQALVDVMNYFRFVAPGGLIAMDDTNWTEGGVMHVRHAIEWLTEQGCQRLAEVDECTMLQRPVI